MKYRAYYTSWVEFDEIDSDEDAKTHAYKQIEFAPEANLELVKLEEVIDEDNNVTRCIVEK